MMVVFLSFVPDDDELLWGGAEGALVEPKPYCGGAYEEKVAADADNENEKDVQGYRSGLLQV